MNCMKPLKLMTVLFGLWGVVTAAAPFELGEWSLSRQRYGLGNFKPKTVVMEFTLKNLRDENMSGIRARVVYTAVTGESVMTSEWKNIAQLKRGGRERLNFTDAPVPVFNSYDLEFAFSCSGKMEQAQYHSTNPAKPPTYLEVSSKFGDIVILGQEIDDLSRKGKSSVVLRVKNLGTQDAENVTAEVDFLDSLGKVIHQLPNIQLGTGLLKAGKMEVYRIPMEGKLDYRTTSFKVRLTSSGEAGGEGLSPEAQLSGGEFDAARSLQLAKFKFHRDDDKTLLIEAQALNNSLEATPRVTVIFTLQPEDSRHKVIQEKVELQSLEPEESYIISKKLPNAPAIAGFSYEVIF